MNILTVNLVLNTFVFWIAARLYLSPRLSHSEPRAVVLPILLLHATRHLGLMFLAPGGVYPGIPQQFAVPAAFGDRSRLQRREGELHGAPGRIRLRFLRTLSVNRSAGCGPSIVDRRRKPAS
jgi:hypothetical protein